MEIISEIFCIMGMAVAMCLVFYISFLILQCFRESKRRIIIKILIMIYILIFIYVFTYFTYIILMGK